LSLAQQAGPPTLPRVDGNACPFECCQFGRWTATRKIRVYNDWRRFRHRSFEIQKGETVTAITGVHVTYKPGHLRVLKDIPELHMKVGDTVLTYMYHGEGYFDFWINGYSGNDQIYTALRCTEATKKETEPVCVVDEGDKEWWVRIKTSSGQTGWVEGNIGFDGTNACG
jgi:hypothetical protein